MRGKAKAAKAAGIDPLVIALAGLLAIAAWSAFRTYYHTAVIQETIQSGEGLALIITDSGIMSDSQKDQAALSSATKGLVNAQRESLVLAICCAGIAAALGLRIYKAGRNSGLSNRKKAAKH